MLIARRLYSQFKPADRCLIRIKDALFQAGVGSKDNPVFGKPIEKFEAYKPGNGTEQESLWAVTGPAKSLFLNVLAGKYIPNPPLSRQYPFMAKTYRYDQVQFLNFRELSGLDSVHMSARYESYSYKGALEMSDDVNCVKNYITGNNNYNKNKDGEDEEYVKKLMNYFNLDHLSGKWINSLSNGQMRRARIAKALIGNPSLLIIDDPFLGLDPEATELVSQSLYKVSQELSTGIIIGLRMQDKAPEWISHLCYITEEEGLKDSGPISEIKPKIENELKQVSKLHSQHEKSLRLQESQLEAINNDQLCPDSIPHIEFKGASVVYRGLPVLENFYWKVEKGSNWRILGNNGTGKTTLLSLVTADHPQSWRSVVSIDGTVRKTGNGISFFDVNNKIGISSPELHALVPSSSRTMYEIIYNGLVKDVGNSNFQFRGDPAKIDPFGMHILDKFQDRLSLNGNKLFGELSISDQKLCLFLRAIIKNPEILILDEAFSCMDDEAIMARCHEVVDHELKHTTVLAIGHIDWEIPQCNYLLKLTGDNNRSYQLMKYL
ncbi:P-loop containing nucleoside triphosphate hydrolase protein [Hyphopichia burtonii NRRL Y-1933]|uniref:p-loop containing nucleoside triphosphate hydrolase protein n=1 Tax=Hyphopichia burtonii NRRL Y-1933 TaxID=984485 RepID=A0A1E4RC56_9ASCO|nr:P-loop containing nucleoside triphosphate hydrolase protein [Hyphopichia burtonii NRRL Y-1933]ODV64842.1 P-loop containing nucleoside triphosphate hydrolase protein [Hyphopichia burtonii NRRL Y-1933]